MNKIRRAARNNLIESCIVLCMLFPLSQYASAAEGDTFQPHISASTTYDDNIFRLSDDLGDAETIAAIGTTDRSDTIYRVEAGLDADLRFSRQRLLLGIGIERNSFTRFDFLNFTGTNANATLQWEVGNHWNGDAGFTYRETLSSFGLLQSRVRDQQVRRTQFVNANYEIGSGLELHGGLEGFDLRRDVLSDRNRDENTSKIGVRYTSRADNFVDLEARFTEGDIGDTGPVDNDFEQSEINAEVDYSRSKSHINGSIGYVQRDQNDSAFRDFDGFTGRVIYDWSVTAKTLISFSAFRRVLSTEDLVSSYTVTRGVSITPSWSPTEKTIVQGRLSHERFNFEGAGTSALPGAPGATDNREDTLRIASISLGYSPFRNTLMALSYQNEDRRSTTANAGYDDNVVTASVRVDF
ncbi:MAG: XrtB/PEP-CTERM-associated polysaccharide biosynthesis outer membrane protein EpsL [Gammaproteobacteria bacterium]